MSAELSPRNPWRPPDWRWRTANELADLTRTERSLRLRGYSDLALRKAARLAAELNDTDDPATDDILERKYTALYWAFRIFRDADSGYRGEIEARILAAESPEDIAMKTGVETSILQAYETTFFDVRAKLKHPSYVLHVVLGANFHRGMAEREYGLLWRYMGYIYGPHMLDAYLNQAASPSRPRGPADVRPAMQDAGYGGILRKQLVAALTVPVNTFTQMDLLNVYAKFVEIDRLIGQDRGGSTSTLLANVNSMLQLLPLDIGEYIDKPRVDSPIMSSYDHSSAELPTAQLMLAAQNVTTVVNVPQNLKYPEPSHHARLEQGS